jgi:GT2 family glycosyltransferase
LKSLRVAVAIPTYQRGPVVVANVERLLALDTRPAEILIVDQTPTHPSEISGRLEAWSRTGDIQWVRLSKPSVPHAMNEALRRAALPIVLFLDDDVIPSPRLIAEHEAAHADGVWGVVGQILQPSQVPCHFDDARLHRGLLRDLEFPFNHDAPCRIENAMAGNLSVNRARALSIGGFDEKFVGAAYRFETDFARRVVAAGGRIEFQPAARVDHLQVPTGGVRAWGDHRMTFSPAHAVGDYYFAMRHIRPVGPYARKRLFQNVLNRHSLRHPWWIPVKLMAELRGYALARRLARGVIP